MYQFNPSTLIKKRSGFFNDRVSMHLDSKCEFLRGLSA